MQKLNEIINLDQTHWKIYREPFTHVIIDNFFKPKFISEIVKEFPNYDSAVWTSEYNNPLEIKKACNHWDKFPKHIYESFTHFTSNRFAKILSDFFEVESLMPDYGLHGGGLHAHKRGGKLNIHKDYSIHPKLNMMRNFNLIVYVTPDWNPEWNGGLEFWSHNEETGKPKDLARKIENKFNRAVIFDTTQNSWHGLPDNLWCPEGVSRNSLAMYYVSNVTEKAEDRKRALYVPSIEQIGNTEIELFCEERSK
jgi:Rps23 Pro-64 3,4-dihydroxylase Tpa1-like proline 4-hydroxylase